MREPLAVGSILRDPFGVELEIIEIRSGKLPTPERPPWFGGGSTAERCALFGSSVRHDTRVPTRPRRLRSVENGGT